ncbi:MAG: DUF3795 domain-containing protein [Candidatus Heimdallarchaeaceae archaeon]
MSSEIIAYCGLNCIECSAYIAKRTNDENLRKKTAKEWSSDDWPVKPEEINCDGCTSEGIHFTNCNYCEVRKCGIEKDLENCAFCESYVCEKLEKLWKMLNSPNAKATLDNIKSNKL